MKGTVAFKHPILCMSRRISGAELPAILCFLSSNIDNPSALSFAGRLLVTDRIGPAIVSAAAMVHYHGALKTSASADGIGRGRQASALRTKRDLRLSPAVSKPSMPDTAATCLRRRWQYSDLCNGTA